MINIEISADYLCYTPFIKSIPSLIAQGKGDMLYQGRNSVWKIEYRKRLFIVKLFMRVNPEQQAVYTFFRPTKAARAFRNAAEFRKRGFSTPHEIAYIEIMENGLFTTGYYISEEARGREVSKDIIKGNLLNERLADAVTRQILCLHNKGIMHGDLNLSNVFYEHHLNGRFTFDMIDLNRSHFYNGLPNDMQCLRNMVRLTHHHDLYEFILRNYAELRGWNAENCVQKAFFLQNQFINRRLK